MMSVFTSRKKRNKTNSNLNRQRRNNKIREKKISKLKYLKPESAFGKTKHEHY